MELSCLLLTSDAPLLELVRNTFSGLGIKVELRTESTNAIELMGRRHIDGFVIDCDDVDGALGALTTIRKSRSNKLSTIFAVLNGKTSVNAAIEAGANFVAGKPVSQPLLQSHLGIALPTMEREHRRYFRHKVNLPITLSCSADTVMGKIINVSEEGLALTVFGAPPVEGTVRIQFVLPGTTAQVFQAKAEVVWRDAVATGVRFLRIEPGGRPSFEAWLKSLEAQQQFRDQ